MSEKYLSFWDHLNELRKVLFRCAIALLAAAVLFFFLKDELFAVLFAPQKDDFITFVWINNIAKHFGFSELIAPSTAQVQLISTELASQFLIHIKITLMVSAFTVLPYFIFELFRFIAPALYSTERKYTKYLLFFSIILFFLGVLLNYFVVFPFSFHFLANYSLNESIKNFFTIDSYISTFIVISVLLGILFELPVLAWMLAKIKVIRYNFIKKYRRHAVVIILIVAAVITPTADIFTLLLVSVPIWLLFELSLIVIRSVEKKLKIEN